MTKRIANYLARQQGKILTSLLGLVAVIFIGILVMAYVISKRANPIILDEHGKPVNEQTTNK
jgi:preprotein translocase subunit SecG